MKQIAIIYRYSDLLSFALEEDGDSITQGKGFATAIGGLTFGLGGALVGGAGKRKTENTCFSLILRILLSDLKNPQIVIPLITKEIKKNKPEYRKIYEKAKAVVAILAVIEEQKGQPAS